jgi:thioredoxin-like negative regulator of GroEL
VNKGIPTHITGLPSEFLQTPLGKMLRPQIEAMFGASRHSSEVSLASPEPAASCVLNCTNLSSLQNTLANNTAVVVNFSSHTCPPCKVIEPKFVELIQEKQKTCSIIAVQVETSVARDICSEFEISATPTFKFFLHGKEIQEFKGADYAELKSGIDFLCFSA